MRHAPPVRPPIHPFSLIELLAVVAIAGILMAVAMPAFTSMMKGSAVDNGARMVSGALKATRSYAISKRKYVALVMPSKITTGTVPSGMPDTYVNCSMRPAIVEKTSTANVYGFRSWVSGESWQTLPDGVSFFELDNQESCNLGDASGFNGGTLTKVNGINMGDVGGGTNVNGIPAILFKPSGKTDGGERFVHVGEGKYTNNQVVVTNPVSGAYATVKVNQYTGRVSYLKNGTE